VAGVPADSTSSILAKAIVLADAGDTECALQLLKSEGKSTNAIVNARCVCLIRLGRGEEARKALRATVMQPDCTWMKPDVPVIYRTNFCISLLLSGHPNGCQSSLMEMTEREHPSVQRVWQTLDAWKRSLTFWQRVQWAVGLEPETQFVLDFVAGDFVEPLSTLPTSVITQNTVDRAASQAV
jgi:hypothetical protein